MIGIFFLRMFKVCRVVARSLCFVTMLLSASVALSSSVGGCDEVAFYVPDSLGFDYYLTGSIDHRVYLQEADSRLSSTQLWRLKRTYPVVTDSSPNQPEWLNIFWKESESRGIYGALFLSLSDSTHNGRSSLTLYPAQLGYYANVNARFDLVKGHGENRLYMILRNTGLYVVPNWKAKKDGIVPVSLSLNPEDFEGWQVISSARKGLCVSKIISSRKLPPHPVF